MRGTLLNTATVAGGAALGLVAGRLVPPAAQEVALSGLGLVVATLGVRMAMGTKSVLAVAAAVALGGVLGVLLRLPEGLTAFAEWSRGVFGGGGRFTEAVVTTSVLFCVGPMTILGCLEDGLTGRSPLLALKSTMDGIGAFFFAAAMGPGVFVTAGVVLVVQGALTLGARRLARLREDESVVREATAAGGTILLATSLGLLSIKALPTAAYLPALVLAPLFARGLGRWEK